MKRLIIILLITMSIQGMGQSNNYTLDVNPDASFRIGIKCPTKGLQLDKSYLELRREYQAYCDSIVIDTITETGNVVFNVVVKNGKPELTASDTTWYEQPCTEYKISNFIGYFNSDGSTLSTLTWANSTGTLSYSKPSKSTFETSITREKYCRCKYKQGSNDDFFEWTDKNYLK